MTRGRRSYSERKDGKKRSLICLTLLYSFESPGVGMPDFQDFQDCRLERPQQPTKHKCYISFVFLSLFTCGRAKTIIMLQCHAQRKFAPNWARTTFKNFIPCKNTHKIPAMSTPSLEKKRKNEYGCSACLP